MKTYGVGIAIVALGLSAIALVRISGRQIGLTEYESIVGGIDNYHESGFRDDPKTLYIIDKNTGEKRTIYRSPKDHLDRISISPDRKCVAFLEFENLENNTLMILDIPGSTPLKLDKDVRRFVWSPDGGMIAYITGPYREGGIGFTTTGVQVFKLAEASRIQVIKDFLADSSLVSKGGGYDLCWAVHDSNLYIQESPALGGNYVYNPRSGRTSSISHKGIHFSPDGRYYFNLNPESLPELYVTASDENITARVRARFGYLPTGWIANRPHHIVVAKKEQAPDEDSLETQRPRAYVAGTRPVSRVTYLTYDVEKDQIEE